MQKENNIHYLGNCIQIDDEGNYFGFDATEFAQAEERALENDIIIDKKDFFRAIEDKEHANYIMKKLGKDVWYSQDKLLDVSWAYDVETDIHYIYDGIVNKEL